MADGDNRQLRPTDSDSLQVLMMFCHFLVRAAGVRGAGKTKMKQE